MEPTAPPTPTATQPTATDTAWPELLPTPEPPPPSWPGAPRDSARGALMLSRDTSPTVMLLTSLSLTPPTAMDPLAIQLVRVTLGLPPSSSP